jgi:hypothetical protein
MPATKRIKKMDESIISKVKNLLEKKLRAKEGDESFWDSLHDTFGIGVTWVDTCSGLFAARDMSDIANSNPGCILVVCLTEEESEQEDDNELESARVFTVPVEVAEKIAILGGIPGVATTKKKKAKTQKATE